MKGGWLTLAKPTSVTLYARGAEIAYQRRRRIRLTWLRDSFSKKIFWLEHAARKPEANLTRDLPLSTSTRKQTGDQLKTSATNLKEGLKPIFGCARWRKGLLKILGLSWLKCLYLRNWEFHWWSPLNSPRVNTASSTSEKQWEFL